MDRANKAWFVVLATFWTQFQLYPLITPNMRLTMSIQVCPASGPFWHAAGLTRTRVAEHCRVTLAIAFPLQPPHPGKKQRRFQTNSWAITVQQISIVEASAWGLSPPCVELMILERTEKRFFKVKGGSVKKLFTMPPIRAFCSPVLCAEAKLLTSR